MSDLVDRARRFATEAHRRIDHRRKYSWRPYQTHLESVARLVAEATDDEETVAAAWLHDTVEDTPATLGDIERHFGGTVAELVEELTDVSRPGDGNRAARKEIDRRHTAQASPRAKTVKLADLIDNCRDITRHDPGFAAVFLSEMEALLEVLRDGDAGLFERARDECDQCRQALADGEWSNARGGGTPRPLPIPGFRDPYFKRTFLDLVTAGDVAENLLSFDSGARCAEVTQFLGRARIGVAGVRTGGSVQGYLRAADLRDGSCADIQRHFTVDQVVDGHSRLTDVIHVLTRHEYCFVTLLGSVAGVICRDDMNKPMVRMWLFGYLTIIEIGLVETIERLYPNDSWVPLVPQGRLEKARQIQAERQRRTRHCELIECLQLSDKGQILIHDASFLERLGFPSRRAARQTMKELESLRNHLAHAQDIVTHDWAQIARIAVRLEEIAQDGAPG